MRRIRRYLTSLIIFSGVIYLVALINFSFWREREETHPLLIHRTELINYITLPGEPLHFKGLVSYTKRCSTYIDRAVFSEKGETVWRETTPAAFYEPLGERKATDFKGAVPVLPEGTYNYRALIPLTCNGRTWSATTPLIPFAVKIIS